VTQDVDGPACADHPVLSSDAWASGVKSGYPTEEGAAALLVCRNSCPVQQWCRKNYQGIEVIAGGGWWDGRGVFRNSDESVMDAYQIAAYLGVTIGYVRYLMGIRKLMSTSKYGGRAWFQTVDVHILATKVGPKHGTARAQNLHVIRGEALCSKCEATMMYGIVESCAA
jgi:hypothetical protein